MAKSNYKIPFQTEKRNKVQRIIRNSIKQGKTPQEIYTKLKSQGLGYRKQNLLADVRLKNATINAKTPQARKNSETWFLKVFEPMREKNKLNSKQAKKLWEQSVSQSYQYLLDAQLGKQFRDLYKMNFKTAPKQDIDAVIKHLES
jgi:predicted transcriptional regulator